MQTLREFFEREDIKHLMKQPVGHYLQYSFTRDPLRPIIYNPDYLYSPADGFILYAKIVKPTENIVEVKGVNYTLRELLRDPDYKHTSLVVGIYMTAYDVHWNRVPTDCWLQHVHLPPIDGYNLSMREIEDAYLRHQLPDLKSATYLTKNERVVNILKSPYYDLPIYIVQIADAEVDRILHFSDDPTNYLQGEKFSLVIGGSQVDLIVPLSQKHFVQNLVHDKLNYHVEAGLDALASIGLIKPRTLSSSVIEKRTAIIKRQCNTLNKQTS